MKETPLILRAARQMLAAGLTPHQGANEISKAMIEESLKEHQGNLCRTARALQMHRNTLGRKLIDLQMGDVVRECRATLHNQRTLSYGGRMAIRTRRDDDAGDRSRVA